MKKLVITLLVIVLVLLALPGLLGKLAQDQLEEQLERGNVNPAFSLSIEDYDRGWFSSQVRYELGFSDEYLELIESATAGDPADNSQSSLDSSALEVLAPFEMVSKISHGPVGFLNGPFFGLFRSATSDSGNNPKLAEFLREAGMPYLLKANSTTSLLGNTTFDFEVPASAANSTPTDSLASKLNFSGATGRGSYSPGSNRVVVSSEMKNLSIKDGTAEISMQGMTLRADQTLITNLNGIGPASFTMSSLVFRDPERQDSPAVTMQDMVFAMDSDYGSSKSTVDVEANYQIGQMLIEDQTITDIELTMTARELSLNALEKYNDWSQEISLIGSKDPGEQEAVIDDLIPLAHEFASTSPQISFDPIRLTANDESFLANLNINLDAAALPELADFDPFNPALWLSLLSGNASLSLSENMATVLAVSSAQSQLQGVLGDQEGISQEQIQQMAVAQAPIVLQTLVQQGMLQAADGQISAAVSFENGELLLNGTPMPLDALMGL